MCIRLLVVLVAALSFAPSFAHVLEAVPRLTIWSPELWRETTVFNAQYRFFALVGAPLDVAAVLVPAAAAYRLRHQKFALYGAATAAMLFGAALLCWFLVVAPVNAAFATWKPGPLQDDFPSLRDRWEFGHILVAVLKGSGLVAAALTTVGPDRFHRGPE